MCGEYPLSGRSLKEKNDDRVTEKLHQEWLWSGFFKSLKSDLQVSIRCGPHHTKNHSMWMQCLRILDGFLVCFLSSPFFPPSFAHCHTFPPPPLSFSHSASLLSFSFFLLSFSSHVFQTGFKLTVYVRMSLNS